MWFGKSAPLSQREIEANWAQLREGAGLAAVEEPDAAAEGNTGDADNDDDAEDAAADAEEEIADEQLEPEQVEKKNVMPLPAITRVGELTGLDGIRGSMFVEVRENGEHIGNYKGRLREGRPHGYGHMGWVCGASWEGQWDKGYMDGYGRFTSDNGAVYEGQMRLCQRQGAGTFAPPVGDKISGLWGEDVYLSTEEQEDLPADFARELNYALGQADKNADAAAADEEERVSKEAAAATAAANTSLAAKEHRASIVHLMYDDASAVTHATLITNIASVPKGRLMHARNPNPGWEERAKLVLLVAYQWMLLEGVLESHRSVGGNNVKHSHVLRTATNVSNAYEHRARLDDFFRDSTVGYNAEVYVAEVRKRAETDKDRWDWETLLLRGDPTDLLDLQTAAAFSATSGAERICVGPPRLLGSSREVVRAELTERNAARKVFENGRQAEDAVAKKIKQLEADLKKQRTHLFEIQARNKASNDQLRPNSAEDSDEEVGEEVGAWSKEGSSDEKDYLPNHAAAAVKPAARSLPSRAAALAAHKKVQDTVRLEEGGDEDWDSDTPAAAAATPAAPAPITPLPASAAAAPNPIAQHADRAAAAMVAASDSLRAAADLQELDVDMLRNKPPPASIDEAAERQAMYESLLALAKLTMTN